MLRLITQLNLTAFPSTVELNITMKRLSVMSHLHSYRRRWRKIQCKTNQVIPVTIHKTQTTIRGENLGNRFYIIIDSTSV